MKKEYTFLEIHNMSPGQRKKNKVSSEVREDENGNKIATWCQAIDGALVISQAVADLERKHFTNAVGMVSVIKIKDPSLITGLCKPQTVVDLKEELRKNMLPG